MSLLVINIKTTKAKPVLTFAIAVFLLIITPGPGVLTLAGVGSAFGYKPGIQYLIGLFIGTNLVALAVVTGLAAVLFTYPTLRDVLLVLSVGYMLFLAYKIAFAGSKVAFIGAKTAPGVFGGLMLQAINPKAYVVNTSLFTGFEIWPDNFVAEITAKFILMNIIWISIHFLWLYAGVSLHRLNLSAKSQFIINICMALAMLSVVGLALWQQFYS